MKDAIYTLIAIPIFLSFVLLEYFYQRRKHQNHYRLNDAITNLNIGVGHIVFNLFTRAFILGAFFWVSERVAFFHIPSGLLSVLIILVVYDFCFYWAHRMSHEINFLWGAHIVHHQSEDYNLTVALRQSWIHSTLAFVFFMPLAFLGIDLISLGIATSLNSFYQFWIHTQSIQKMPRWFEFIFNTPAHHRVHHGVNPKYIDKNHGGMFIIWDRLFGTFMEEEETPTFGITKNMNSWNPVFANIHYYVELFNIGKVMKLKDKFKLWFGRPGWMPLELGGQQFAPQVNKSTYLKYNATASTSQNVYVFAQFLLILIGACGLIYYFEALSPLFQVSGLFFILLSSVICSGILEQKNWVKYAELLRIPLVILFLNSLYYFQFTNWFRVMAICSGILGVYFFGWFVINAYYKTSVMQLVKARDKG